MIERILTVGGFTLLSRITGFARDILLATILGAGPVADQRQELLRQRVARDRPEAGAGAAGEQNGDDRRGHGKRECSLRSPRCRTWNRLKAGPSYLIILNVP